MKVPVFLLSGLLAGPFLAAGCGMQICGPAYPEKNGGQYLRQAGYASETVTAVIARAPLDHKLVVELTACRSSDIRYLVAGNPHLTGDEIGLYMADGDDFARSGAATNPSLSPAQMQTLMKDPSHTVYARLAGNPAVPPALLLQLHKERHPGLLWFAMNPKCPDELKREIRASDDDLAKHWLNLTEKNAAAARPPTTPSGAAVNGAEGR